MRLSICLGFIAAALVAFFCTPAFTAAAQTPGSSVTPKVSWALPGPDSASPLPSQLTVIPLTGQVSNTEGEALAGATLLFKGTQQVYVTDADGHFSLSESSYQGRILIVQAAGYRIREIAVSGNSLPRLVLRREAGAQSLTSGKRKGQVVKAGKPGILGMVVFSEAGKHRQPTVHTN